MTDPELPVAAEVATALLHGSLESIERIRGLGRNSGVFRIRHAGLSFALKRYPPRRPDERDRTTIEAEALRFMRDNGITTVPCAIAADPVRGYALLEWIQGDEVATPHEADIDAACRFLGSIHALRSSPGARDQPLAAEACLSGAEIVSQIKRRLERLETLAVTEPALAAFLKETVGPLFVQIAEWAEMGYAAGGLSFATPIPEAARTLCPADFGFHNAMRLPSGQLAFIDFDYFGWDDPVKLVCDFLLHPGMRLTEQLKHRFADASRLIYETDDAYGKRLPLLFPLFALRWCLILLNEFLPERWAQRRNAGDESDWSCVKQDQLDRARRSVHSLADNFRWFPYGS
jgi:hypothetical protein